MNDRKDNTEKVPPSSSDTTRLRASGKSKRDERRVGFDALADEEPQICRGID